MDLLQIYFGLGVYFWNNYTSGENPSASFETCGRLGQCKPNESKIKSYYLMEIIKCFIKRKYNHIFAVLIY